MQSNRGKGNKTNTSKMLVQGFSCFVEPQHSRRMKRSEVGFKPGGVSQDAGFSKALRNRARRKRQRADGASERWSVTYLSHGKRNPRNTVAIHVSSSHTQSNKAEIHFISISSNNIAST